MPASEILLKPLLNLRSKLERVTLVRALMVTLLLGSAVVLNINDLDSFAEPSYLGILSLILFTYLATVVYSVWLRHVDDPRNLAYVQLVGDALISAGLVVLTGGSESVFLFLFFLTIVTAAHLDGRGGALFEASVCSIAYSLILLAEEGYVPLLGRFTEIFGGQVSLATYGAAVNIIAFYAVAILAGHLAEKLGQAGTELERSQLDIRELRALNEYIVNSIGGGLCTLDLDGRIISFNNAAELITGRPARQVLGNRLNAALPEMVEVFEHFRSQHGTPQQAAELPLPIESGQRRYLSVSVAPLHKTSGETGGHIINFEDVTEVRRLRRILQHHQRLAAIGELSASIAHEIRNPLASITGAIQVLRASTRDDDEASARLMDIVVREVDRLNLLVEDFLAYARPRELRISTLDLPELIRDTTRLVKHDLEQASDIEFDITHEGDDLVIEADADSLRQVLWNLFRNAVEAMEGAGTISVTAVPLLAGSPPVRHVEVAISDTGPGLSDISAERLFEPFHTTKKKGSGLGLATVLRIIEAHGGLVWADEPDDTPGATFRFLLPVAYSPDANTDVTAELLAVGTQDVPAVADEES